MARTRPSDPVGTGSPVGEPDYLVVGFLRRPHGVRGEIVMDLHTDFPERLKAGRKLFIGGAHKPMTLAGCRVHGKGRLVALRGVDTPESAGQFRNQWVFIKTKDAPALPEGQYYQHQLIGLNVVDEEDRPLGKLTEIIETGANDVYVVTKESGEEILLPAIPSVILELQPGSGFMRVRLIEGL